MCAVVFVCSWVFFVSLHSPMELKGEHVLPLKIDLNTNYLAWFADVFMITILKYHETGVEWGGTILI